MRHIYGGEIHQWLLAITTKMSFKNYSLQKRKILSYQAVLHPHTALQNFFVQGEKGSTFSLQTFVPLARGPLRAFRATYTDGVQVLPDAELRFFAGQEGLPVPAVGRESRGDSKEAAISIRAPGTGRASQEGSRGVSQT